MVQIRKLLPCLTALVSLLFLCNCTRMVKKPDDVLDILKVKEQVKAHFANIWQHSERVYELHDNTTQDIMNEYWSKIIAAFTDMNDAVKYFDRKIQRAQPSTLMNILFPLNNMDALDLLAKTPTSNDSTFWYVRFVEISSLATQANWFYNKRIYDILHASKYLKTIADSIFNLYGYPWLAPISVRKGENVTSRLQMRRFWELAEELIERETHENIFAGLRKLIDKSANVLSSSSVDSDACTNQDYGEIIPIRLDSPLYICMYLTLFHVKMYVLRSFSYIYQQVYGGVVFPDVQLKLNQRVDDYIDATIRLYNRSFYDYQSVYKYKLIPVMGGYFKCDPDDLKTNPKRYIEIFNFLTFFLSPQKWLDPTGECAEACSAVGTKPSTINCEKATSAKDKAFCAQLPCPLDQIICSKHSNPRAIACASSNPRQLYAWFELGYKHWGPYTNCPADILGFSGTSVNVTKHRAGEMAKKNTVVVATRANSAINDEAEDEDEECEVCLCQCYAPVDINGNKSSVRKFSLKSVMAKIEENRVVVGVKFEQVADQIHLMIGDAVLSKSYYVDMSSIVWRDASLADTKETVSLDVHLKSVYLQSWKVHPDYAITGIRFVESFVKAKEGSVPVEPYIGIQIMQTRVDEHRGVLVPADSMWLEKESNLTGNSHYDGYGEPDTPLNIDGMSLPDSAAEQLITFQSTSLSVACGQTIIPFFDAQKVYFGSKPFALKGLGIYHRHRIGYGGFIGIKLLPYEDKHFK